MRINAKFTRVALVSALVFLGVLTFLSGTFMLGPYFDVRNVAISLIYGLLLASLLMIVVRFISFSLARFVLVFVAAGILGLILTAVLFFLDTLLPRGNWEPLETPPEPLVRFVANTPIHFFGGEIYASTAEGTLYAYGCDGNACTWDRREELPPPPDPSSYWSGTCAGGNTPSGFILKPLPPGRVIASHATRYCGPDYETDTFFILLQDGSVWSWSKFSSALGYMVAFLAGGLAGPIAGFAGALALLIGRPKGSW